MGKADILYILGYLTTDFLNYTLCYYLIFGFTLKKSIWKWLLTITGVLTIQIVLSAILGTPNARHLCILTMLVIPLFLLDGRKKDRFGLYLFIYLGMSVIGTASSFLISLFLGTSVNEVVSDNFLSVVCETIPFITLAVTFLIMKMRGTSPKQVHLGKKTYFLFYVGVLCSFAILGTYQNLSKLVESWNIICKSVSSEEIHDSGNLLEISPALDDLNTNLLPQNLKLGILLGAFACIVFLYLILWHGIAMHREIEYREQIKTMNKFNQMREEYFQELIFQDEKIRRFRHDMRAHLAALNGYCQTDNIDEIRKYLKTISEDHLLDSAKVYTKDKGVDAIISSLCNQAVQKNIKMEINGTLKLRADITSFEMSSIFYNLTQNAIEACEKLPDEMRNIAINMSDFNNHSIITISNPVLKKVNIANGQIATDKEDKQNHGLGTRNVTDIVKKHNGTIDFKCDEKCFKVDVVI